MQYRLSIILILSLLFSGLSNPLELKAGKKNIQNNILNKFCMATLKSKIDKNKKDFKEISNYTCQCFFKKFNSGMSIKNSRLYCKMKASEKYNL